MRNIRTIRTIRYYVVGMNPHPTLPSNVLHNVLTKFSSFDPRYKIITALSDLRSLLNFSLRRFFRTIFFIARTDIRGFFYYLFLGCLLKLCVSKSNDGC